MCPVLLLGTYLSTWSVMNRSTDKAFREISNSIVSACSCSSCRGTSTALGFQAPFPRSYRETGCWLCVGNHRLGRKPEHCKTNSASHLDCASAACLPGQPQKSLQPSVACPLSPYPKQVMGGYQQQCPCTGTSPERDQSQAAPLSRSGIVLWLTSLQRPVRLRKGVAASSAEKPEEGETCPGMATGLHPLLLDLPLPSAYIQPATISACGYPSPQLPQALQPPSLLPFPAAWIPCPSPTCPG